MNQKDLRYLFFGDDDEDLTGSSENPYSSWIEKSIKLGATEKKLVEQLDTIEKWMYLENVWYFAIRDELAKFPQAKIKYPNLYYYVSRRIDQYDGDDFPEAYSFIENIICKNFVN